MYSRRPSTTGSFSSKPTATTGSFNTKPSATGSFNTKPSATGSFSTKGKSTKTISKSNKDTKRSFRDSTSVSTSSRHLPKIAPKSPAEPTSPSGLNSPTVTLCVGPSGRLFACHEDVLKTCPFFAGLFKNNWSDSKNRKVQLPDDIPEVFSCVLEFLYKGDYYPRLLHNKRNNCNELEDASKNQGSKGAAEATVTLERTGKTIMKDTLIYCTAEKYGLEELKRVALKKQGLRTGMQCQTILSSARYAYENTPDSDSKLRAHYLALIVRSRSTFKRSGTMQMEMEAGGKMFFDLFVAMANYIEDLSSPPTPGR